MIYLYAVTSIIFCLSFTALHGNIAKQLEEMFTKDKRLANIFKGQWHTAGLIVRLSVIALLTVVNWRIGLSYALFSFTFYDALLNAWRGLSFYHFTGTCEHWGNGFDTDCVWVWIQKHLHLQPVVLKALISLIIGYFIWSL